jgi:hypothetical protein
VPHAPEYDLLLDAAIPLAHRRVRTITWDGADWGRALSAADWHRLSPLLYSHVLTVADTPPAVLHALERGYLANAARSLFLRSELEKVLGLLSAAGVEAMLLKGAALVETVYRDPAHREMLDLDLLVRGDQLPAANAALRAAGYGTTDQTHTQSTPSAAVPHHDPALIGASELAAIELHHHIALADEGGDFAIDGFWERARTSSATGHLLPAPEDLLIHLCLHFTRNRLGGSARHRNTGGALGQVTDIARVVEAGTVDWELLERTARAFALEARVFLALFVAGQLGARVPGAALVALRPRGFDDAVGRRLVTLRVMRSGDHLPVRSIRWMLAPGTEALRRGWNADPTATMSLARAYLRRARAHVPAARSALRRPWTYIQDQRLNDQIHALEQRR